MTSQVLVGTKGGLCFTGSGTASEFEGREVRSLDRPLSTLGRICEKVDLAMRGSGHYPHSASER